MKANQIFKQILVLALIVGANSAVNGDVVQPNSALASSEFSSSYAAENTINGSGMSTIFDETDTHQFYTAGNHWTTASSTLPEDAWILWGFNSGQSLDGMFVWNHLSNNIASNPGYEPVLADLTLLDSSDNVLLFMDDVSLTPDTGGVAEFISFGFIVDNVSSVRFEVEAVQSSSDFTGLAEVGFRTAAIPEPSSTVVILAGCMALAGVNRRR
jgi:hypothetical protein